MESDESDDNSCGQPSHISRCHKTLAPALIAKLELDEGIVRTASNRGGIQSSVRDLNCSLKWGNERNPRCLLHVSGETAQLSVNFQKFLFWKLGFQIPKRKPSFLKTSKRKFSESWEEGEDDARSACPFDILGYTHNTMATTTRCDGVTPSQS